MTSWTRVLAALAIAMLWPAAVMAQEPANPLAPDTQTEPLDPLADTAEPTADLPDEPLPEGVHRLTRTDVDAWLDGYMPYALREADIAGAVVTVVQDGEILTSRGFGYADLDTLTPVNGDETMFRPGSISKLFT